MPVSLNSINLSVREMGYMEPRPLNR